MILTRDSFHVLNYLCITALQIQNLPRKTSSEIKTNSVAETPLFAESYMFVFVFYFASTPNPLNAISDHHPYKTHSLIMQTGHGKNEMVTYFKIS